MIGSVLSYLKEGLLLTVNIVAFLLSVLVALAAVVGGVFAIGGLFKAVARGLKYVVEEFKKA